VVAPSEADWKALAGGLSGRLSRPGNSGYPVDLELYDPRFDGTHPAAIAFCANASDVARSITFAREHGLALTARSGGHSYAGYSTTSGLVVDVSRMSTVSVKGEVATVGAGAELIDVYSGLAQMGVSIPAGSCPTVGIAGLALGGGIGVMDRLHGVTCDNIVGLTLVTAAGDVVRADAATNPDLYWACRGGGGGNFGVVTEFRFATFPVMDISLFSLTWPWSAAATLVPAWMEWSSSGPDELWSNCLLEAYPGAATPHVQVGGTWAGSAGDAEAQLSKLVDAVGPPSSQSLGENGFEDVKYIEAGCPGMSEAACHLVGKYPGGTLPRMVSLAKSDIFNAPLSAAGVRALLAGVEERQSQGGPGGVVLDSWGGAISRVAPGATAFVHRRALASAQYLAEFPAGVASGNVRAAARWMNSWHASLRPYVSGEAYQNYIDPALADWAHAYYGANLRRLQKVKAKWDPDGVWRFAQSIPPL
jgi:FAD/FMN-containing dehydrogenase